ncbi:hypothetical protein VitviT2T_024090 [Vitis vinifera]|uniref:F-box/kelch-repeat protein n=1 Tax=Vitis vinifera TaxID=29760 RepID=A0ABY9DEP2_VITVI|nr:hypothetical protein VitviT2T_024090 [Vitis vinifera]
MRRWRAEERGSATSVRVVGHWRDLCGSCRPSAGSLLVSRQGCVNSGRRRGGKLPVCMSWAAGGTYVSVAAVASRWRDLSWTLGVADGTLMVGGGGRVGAWRLQRRSLEIWRF